LRDGPRAVELARRACEGKHRDNPVFHATLAAAQAESGNFSEAVATASKALEMAQAASDVRLVASLQKQLELYRVGKPFHQEVKYPSMKAVILAAGKGTRMKELTNELPKPMLKVHDKPILEHILDGVIAAGIRDVFIVTGFKAGTIENYFGNGAKWNVRIAYGRQLVQDGTGKAPELAKDSVGNYPFLLTYGDILVKPETYSQMLARFREADFAGVITVTGSEDVTKGGLVFFDEQFCMKRLVEKPSLAQLDELRRDGWLKPGATAWYNAGIYVFKPLVFDFTAKLEKSPRGEYELTDALSAMLAARHSIAGMQIPGRWVDVRDPEVLARLEAESQD
jgi:NDP-sugar pyrophosphorylase family protein